LRIVRSRIKVECGGRARVWVPSELRPSFHLVEMVRPTSMGSYRALGRKERPARSVPRTMAWALPTARARLSLAWASSTEMVSPTTMAEHQRPGPLATNAMATTMAWLREQAPIHPDRRP
jgi:hypothetical protein